MAVAVTAAVAVAVAVAVLHVQRSSARSLLASFCVATQSTRAVEVCGGVERARSWQARRGSPHTNPIDSFLHTHHVTHSPTPFADGIMRTALLALLLPAAAHAIATQAQLDTLRAAIIANFSLEPSYGGPCGATGCTQGHVIG